MMKVYDKFQKCEGKLKLFFITFFFLLGEYLKLTFQDFLRMHVLSVLGDFQSNQSGIKTKIKIETKI